MALHVYTAWLRDLSARPDDQNYEFPAGILIDAGSAEAAQAWGDNLAQRRCARGDLHFHQCGGSEAPPELGGLSGRELLNQNRTSN